MRVLLIDNYDSYTYNLCQLIGSVLGGQAPVVARNDDATTLAPLLNEKRVTQASFEAVVISPGPGRPDRVADFGLCRRVIQQFPTHQVPILGVCLGHQGIVESFGGRIIHAKRPVHGEVASIHVEETESQKESLFRGLPANPFRAVRYHSLVAEVSSLPSCLETLAWCIDEGTQERILMAVRHRVDPIFGVQFHIESIGTEFGEQILCNFFAIAQTYRRKKRASFDGIPRMSPRSALAEASTQSPRGVSNRPEWFAPYRRRCVQLRRLSPKEVVGQPVDCFLRLYGSDATREVFWLDSCYEYRQNRWPSVRWSIMGEWESTSVLDGTQVPFWEVLDRTLAARAEMWPTLPESETLPPFIGGYLGYIGYELKRESFDAPRASSSAAPEAADAFLGWVHRAIIFDHQTGGVLLATNDDESACPTEAENWMRHVEQMLKEKPNALDFSSGRSHPEHDRCAAAMTGTAPNGAAAELFPRALHFEWQRSRHQYLEDVRTCLDRIRDGESYEICLTNQLLLRSVSLPAGFHPLAHYLELRSTNAAPFAAYLQLGPDRVICCASPERFLLLCNGTYLESRPIKGTMHRSADPEEDVQLGTQLAQSRKDRAENLMIVDLVRNDFGRVCAPGTIRVPQLMRLETFATVHQLVSAVQGCLHPPASETDRAALRDAAPVGRILKACFPMGSMTGAPKQRTMEIIDALEKHPRGIYSGSIGYVSADGQQADWNVVIRTAVWERLSPARGATSSTCLWRVSIGVGGAIVTLSDPEDEFAEMVLKAKAVIESIRKALHVDRVHIQES
ncbi:hypothetical protein CCYA_CCYA04G1412 [Cyanidiococcus yangmingshanensis]|nr:hypothetical protein CCYA_CCYA04G1412 [Cyanidiococcus yangmingshanensis]